MESLNLVLEGPDLAHEVGSFVGGDTAGNNGARDSAGAALTMELANSKTKKGDT